MRTKTGIQFSTYLTPDQLAWLRDKSKRSHNSISGELRALLETAIRRDSVLSEIDRCLA
ncbi:MULTISPECIES: hypothetical protein [unclassified Mesorhizobium]|uniref:hypothetical protein n=1 Tax=unclassified Mesorhizobium TaxID=325217 RepID=UPI001673E80A|nr:MULTISPECIES: hypothetical protein [unclassified Mesorhizobium]